MMNLTTEMMRYLYPELSHIVDTLVDTVPPYDIPWVLEAHLALTEPEQEEAT